MNNATEKHISLKEATGLVTLKYETARGMCINREWPFENAVLIKRRWQIPATFLQKQAPTQNIPKDNISFHDRVSQFVEDRDSNR